ncbi:MAG TPA: BrxA/BrxB family bacilliredoxin [Vicinamibacterales bacterium]|nr:BrxA/BrxB family bacilliredoxin [Vicinamibacterales bacterium]
MRYPESFIGPMREELTRLGVEELRTPEAVDALLSQKGKTIMVVVNSMCGCAAGKARPGVALALQHPARPDIVATVFAGGDIEATARAREYFAALPPSSPSIAIMRDGAVVHFVHRHEIERQSAEAIARNLTDAFDRLCTAPAQG